MRICDFPCNVWSWKFSTISVDCEWQIFLVLIEGLFVPSPAKKTSNPRWDDSDGCELMEPTGILLILNAHVKFASIFLVVLSEWRERWNPEVSRSFNHSLRIRHRRWKHNSDKTQHPKKYHWNSPTWAPEYKCTCWIYMTDESIRRKWKIHLKNTTVTWIYCN